MIPAVERHTARLVGDVLALRFRRLDEDCIAITARHDADTAAAFRALAEDAIRQDTPRLTEWVRQVLTRELRAD